MTKNTHINPYYSTPEDFPIPEGTDPVEALRFTLDRAEGVLSLLTNNNTGHIVDSGTLTAQAVWAVEGMIRQCKALVEYWHEKDDTDNETSLSK